MTQDKIKEIIEQRNGRLEQAAVNRAGDIIDAIGKLQKQKAEADVQIAELREELKKLEIEQVNTTSILG